MAVDNITVDLLLNPLQYQAGLAAAQAQAAAAGAAIDNKLTTSGARSEAALSRVGTMAKVGLGIAAVATVAAGVASVKMAGDFQQSLNVLQSVTGATGGEMSALSAKARELGKDVSLPGISSRDAAGAMTELAKAGLGVNDVLGASKGVLSLAKAGQLEVSDAATIAARALNTFGLSGDQAGKVADLLAAGANSSTASVSDMAQALAQGGAGAKQMGVSVGDTVTALAIFSNAGVNASDAGTSLKTMFQRLAAPTDESSAAMKQLGLNFFDAQGSFIGLSATAGQLQDKLGGLTVEQRNQALAAIFGSDASRVAGILASQGAAGFDKMSAAVNKSGAAADLAAAQNKGFNGALDNLKSTAETLATDLGTKLLPSVTAVVNFLSGNLVPILVGVVAGVAALGVVFVATSVSAATFASIMAVILSPLVAIPVIVGLLVAAFVALDQKFHLVAAATQILGAAWELIKPVFQSLGAVIKTVLDGIKAGFDAVWPYILKAWAEIKVAYDTQLKPAFDSLKRSFAEIGVAIQPLLPYLKQFGVVIGVALGVAVLGAVKVLVWLVQAFAWVMQGIAPIISFLAPGVTAAFQLMADGIRMAGTIMLSVAGAILSGMMMVAKAIDAVIPGPDKIVPKLEGLKSGVDSAMAGISAIAGGHAQSAAFAIESPFRGTVTSVAGAMAALPGAIQDPLLQAQVQGAVASGMTVSQILGNFGNLPPNVRGILASIPGDVSLPMLQAALSGNAAAQQTVMQTLGPLQGMPAQAGAAVAPTPGAISGALAPSAPAAAGQGSATLTSLVDQLGQMPGASGKAVSGTPGQINANIAGAQGVASSQGAAASAALVAQVGAMPGRAGSAASPTPGAVQSQLGGMGSIGSMAGSALASMMASAISAGVGWVGAAASKLAAAAKAVLPGSDAEKGPLSNLTHDLAQLPIMFADALLGGIPNVSSAAGRLAAAAQVPLSSNFGVSSQLSYPGSSIQGEGLSGGGVVINQQNDIRTEVDMDMVNRDLAWELRR